MTASTERVPRSFVNGVLERALAFCDQLGFHLPPFARWSPADWATKGNEYDEIRENRLGWDLTDFGLGRYEEVGLVLFTLRNGNPKGLVRYPKRYCEKLLIVGDNQHTPYHFHETKMEDIICRGGGELKVKVYNAAADGRLADTPVTVNVDGRTYQVPAGEIITLTPGESITLPPFQYHEFWAEGGTALVIEVSAVNDDEGDNFFADDRIGRFPEIEEDVAPNHYLCWEYPPAPGLSEAPKWHRKPGYLRCSCPACQEEAQRE
ncbi:MAG: D-lyxose/D-mannose family sugar isomerase [Candidatus Zipacnadales bacterium]